MKKMLIRLIVLLIVGAAGVGAAIAYKQAAKTAREKALLEELFLDLTSLDLDERGRAYVNGLAEAAHEGAIAKAFIPGGFMSGTYDVNVYQRAAVDSMLARARADGSTHIAEALEAFKLTESRLDLLAPAAPRSGG